MADNRKVDLETVRETIAQHKQWYHRIEVYPGLITPGINDSQLNLKRFDGIGLPTDCTGMRVLDIGCSDGFFSFLVEKRGAAEVIAVDYRKPTTSGFDIASKLLNSKVQYFVDNVYELSPEKYGLFDIILFFGVLYHLRNPLLAFDKIRALIKKDGLLFVETYLIDNNLQLPDGSMVSLDKLSPTLKNIPLWQFYRRDSLNNDLTNKWAPNITGLKYIVEEAQFHVLKSEIFGTRGSLSARAIEDTQLDFSHSLDIGKGL